MEYNFAYLPKPLKCKKKKKNLVSFAKGLTSFAEKEISQQCFDWIDSEFKGGFAVLKRQLHLIWAIEFVDEEE